VVHSPVGYGPTFARSRLIAHVHDLTSVEHPEWHPWKANQFMRATIPYAARHAATVLTHSRFVADRVRDTLGIEDARIVTIPPPLSRSFTRQTQADARIRVQHRFGLEGDFILHVGTLEPRKNHVRLIGAFERLHRAGFPGPLVLVGQEGWRTGPILDRIRTSPVSSRIVRVSDATDHDLVALYQTCTLCAYPSLEEGFGMPLLESMHCGAACVTSDHAALVELGRGIAVTVPCEDEIALADAMLRMWRDPDDRRIRGELGVTRAFDYRFERWENRIFDLYRRELAAAESDS
jgi:alpha-1,3-rhamnosyl/mannosyltransferase